MRIEHAPPLPREFSRHPKAKHLVVAEADIRQTRGSRLAAKLLVFNTPTDLRKFWMDVLDRGDLGDGCTGAVNALGYEAIDIYPDGTEVSRWVCDPRYFCLIGLCVGHLSTEVVMHEAVHAGFCYAKRIGRDPWNDDRELGEEHVAYPAGRIAAGINRFLWESGLYEREAAA